MKYIIYVAILVFGYSCTVPGGMVRQKPLSSDIAFEENEEEYDIIIDDPGFSSWLVTNGHPANFYSNEYYRQKNINLVSLWNERFLAYNGRDPYNFQVNYDYSIDYGFEVNYQLYHYFKYLQQAYRLNLPV
ncbi:MAG: DUF6146 family protein [Candidatus Cyclobacteriaceae bacterium M3_2C_046]